MSRVVRYDFESQPCSLRGDLHHTGMLAVRALHAELVLSPKPGLVSPRDSGSHTDMNATTFMRSLFALRHYFPRIAFAGARGAAFGELKRLGIVAETRMLGATGGVNTHRGAIFALGLLAAGAGYLHARNVTPSPNTICDLVRIRWGAAIANAMSPSSSHGALVLRRYRVSGARKEAASGFPIVLRIGVPALESALASGLSARRSQLQALFSLMCHVSDTTLLYRGGREGLSFTQASAMEYLRHGGAYADDWQERAAAIHRDLVARRLSPGGSADLLSATWYLHLLRSAWS